MFSFFPSRKDSKIRAKESCVTDNILPNVGCMSSGGFGQQLESTAVKTQAGKSAKPKESADIAYTLCYRAFLFY